MRRTVPTQQPPTKPKRIPDGLHAQTEQGLRQGGSVSGKISLVARYNILSIHRYEEEGSDESERAEMPYALVDSKAANRKVLYRMLTRLQVLTRNRFLEGSGRAWIRIDLTEFPEER